MKLARAASIVQGTNWVINQYYDYIQKRNLNAERAAIATIMDRPARIRTGSWSASSAGTCGRARQFVYLGFKKKRVDDKTMNIFANGDYVHIRHQAFGMVAGYVTAAEVSVTYPMLNLTGTMDGLLSNEAIGEWKSINTYGFGQVQSFGARADHVRQVHAYMLATDRESAHIVYEDKNTNNLKEIVVQRDPAIIQEVVKELVELNQATAEKRLLPMLPECRQFKGQYNWCPFAPICEGAVWPRD